ncbi:hypothetical protein [Microcoleus sp.]
MPFVGSRFVMRSQLLMIELAGFCHEDAKQFGKLSKIATWEALLGGKK